MPVISNASNDMLDVAPQLNAAVDLLGSIAKLLDSKYIAKRLKASCFVSGELGEALHKDLDRWAGRVYNERWGTVDICIMQVLKLMLVLLWGWHKDRYLHMSGGGVSDEGQIALCDDELTSDFW